jgi:hypothetical protein
MDMLIVKMPMSSLFEFASNFIFTNTKCVSLSKPILLECKENLKQHCEPPSQIHLGLVNKKLDAKVNVF